MKADDPIRISIDEMLTDETIKAIGADHADPAVCVTRICGYVRRLEEELRWAADFVDPRADPIDCDNQEAANRLRAALQN